MIKKEALLLMIVAMYMYESLINIHRIKQDVNLVVYKSFILKNNHYLYLDCIIGRENLHISLLMYRY